jgi:nucleotide-binding universal stress UspA family protein
LNALVARHSTPSLRLDGHLRLGPADDELLAVAAELGATMIVVGTHGRTGAAHLLLGSVAERVVRKSPLPVLTVRTPA